MQLQLSDFMIFFMIKLWDITVSSEGNHAVNRYYMIYQQGLQEETMTIIGN